MINLEDGKRGKDNFMQVRVHIYKLNLISE